MPPWEAKTQFKQQLIISSSGAATLQEHLRFLGTETAFKVCARKQLDDYWCKQRRSRALRHREVTETRSETIREQLDRMQGAFLKKKLQTQHGPGSGFVVQQHKSPGVNDITGHIVVLRTSVETMQPINSANQSSRSSVCFEQALYLHPQSKLIIQSVT